MKSESNSSSRSLIMNCLKAPRLRDVETIVRNHAASLLEVDEKQIRLKADLTEARKNLLLAEARLDRLKNKLKLQKKRQAEKTLIRAAEKSARAVRQLAIKRTAILNKAAYL